MTDDVRQLVTPLITAWNAHAIERLATLYAPDYEGIDIAQARPQHGPQELCRVLTSYVEAFPDLHCAEETVVQDNRAALIWTRSGTNRGTLMHISPTGRTIEVRGVSVLTIVDGKAALGLSVWDLAGLVRALDLLPALYVCWMVREAPRSTALCNSRQRLGTCPRAILHGNE